MNALSDIRSEAKVIVENLANRQIDKMKTRHNEFIEWFKFPGNALIKPYSNGELDSYSSVWKFIYLTKYTIFNRERREFENPTVYDGHRSDYELMKNRDMVNLAMELRMMNRGNWEASYRSEFTEANMFKLERALNKHLNDEMSAENISVRVGGDGAEVTANVDNKFFKTFGTLCGGYIQVYHYRYRSSLK